MTTQDSVSEKVNVVSALVVDVPVIDIHDFKLYLKAESAQAYVKACVQQAIPPGWDKARFHRITKFGELDKVALFQQIEGLLESLPDLHYSCNIPFTKTTWEHLTNSYYHLEPVMARLLVGKKLTQKKRKKMDNIAEQNGITERCALRQFDNMTRVFEYAQSSNHVFDATFDELFDFSTSLKEEYMALYFAQFHQLELRKTPSLANTPWRDLSQCLRDTMRLMCPEHSIVLHEGLISVAGTVASIFTDEVRTSLQRALTSLLPPPLKQKAGKLVTRFVKIFVNLSQPTIGLKSFFENTVSFGSLILLPPSRSKPNEPTNRVLITTVMKQCTDWFLSILTEESADNAADPQKKLYSVNDAKVTINGLIVEWFVNILGLIESNLTKLLPTIESHPKQ
ncbi:putative Acidic fibroblast growth factor binding (FIBP) [Blattamonas nauphoetae]|uniref:Acidic fibroblast growth factor binding (FIBP) n=1 Tax=Blattamonas nauphoetae TaxID=2049346 RepID=A0ABQ9XES8_9EUKA|nr:putative Acidic fibroblast growth factor binding (FIBP) [Blattamonas nauphoetae]